jgi:hypothetical protein
VKLTQRGIGKKLTGIEKEKAKLIDRNNYGLDETGAKKNERDLTEKKGENQEKKESS